MFAKAVSRLVFHSAHTISDLKSGIFIHSSGKNEIEILILSVAVLNGKVYYNGKSATSVWKTLIFLRTAFLRVVTRRVEVFSYRQVVPKRRYGITTIRCVTTQKNTVLIYFAAEA